MPVNIPQAASVGQSTTIPLPSITIGKSIEIESFLKLIDKRAFEDFLNFQLLTNNVNNDLENAGSKRIKQQSEIDSDVIKFLKGTNTFDNILNNLGMSICLYIAINSPYETAYACSAVFADFPICYYDNKGLVINMDLFIFCFAEKLKTYGGEYIYDLICQYSTEVPTGLLYSLIKQFVF